MFPDSIEKFKEQFAKLPSIGPRQASRLAFYLLKRRNFSNDLISSLKSLLEKISICKNCLLPFEKDNSSICPICSDNNRDKKTICLLEKELDAFSIENAGRYKGTYHILGQMINPADPKSYEKLGLNILENRIKNLENHQADEIIIAVNPTTEGDLTAMYLERRLKGLSKKISRLGRGIPTGGEIEFADEETLFGAFQNRR